MVSISVMTFSWRKRFLYFLIPSLLLQSVILYKNLEDLLQSIVSIYTVFVSISSNYPFFPELELKK